MVAVALPPATKYILQWEGFDYDGGRENILQLNGRVVGSFPPSDTPANGQLWTKWSLDITASILQGSNILVFSHAPFDCNVNDDVRNLMIVDQNGNVVFSDPTERIVNCTTSTSYTFNIGGSPIPPGPQNTVLTIGSALNPSAPAQAVNFTGILSVQGGAGLGGKTVTLQQSTDNGVTWTNIGSANTSSTGGYSISATFATAGAYLIRTAFAGA